LYFLEICLLQPPVSVCVLHKGMQLLQD